MKQEEFFEFIGEREIGYTKGSEYALVITSRTLSQRLRGLLFNLPFSWKIIILKPVPFAYKSLDDFHKDWKYKYMSFSG